MKLKNLSTLQVALGLSVLVHAVPLTVRFVDPVSFNRIFQEAPLEVILVNAKSTDLPVKATAIAQASLAGGGELLQGRATSPLPPSALTAVGDSADDSQRQVEAMQAQQTQLLAQIRRQLDAVPLPDPRHPADPVEHAASEQKRRQMVQLLAEIERRVNEQNARPRKRSLSPATRVATYAVYVDSLRRRIEAHGTDNFPQSAGKKIYGALDMTVIVNFDGRVFSTKIDRSSGNMTLDRQAQAIVRGIGSVGNFTAEMRRGTDQIEIQFHFDFTRDETVRASASLSADTH